MSLPKPRGREKSSNPQLIHSKTKGGESVFGFPVGGKSVEEPYE